MIQKYLGDQNQSPVKVCKRKGGEKQQKKYTIPINIRMEPKPNSTSYTKGDYAWWHCLA